MSDYGTHVLYLVFALLAVLCVFIAAFAYGVSELWMPAFAGVIVLVGVIAVLARWDGDRGKTD